MLHFNLESAKDRKKLAADLKPIYQAITEEEAQEALESFEAKWGKNYPQIDKSWYNNWDNLKRKLYLIISDF